MPRADTTAPKAGREEVLGGMQCIDTSGNPRIPLLMEMVGALSRAVEPQEVLRAFSQGIEEVYGPRGYVSISTRGLEAGQYKITRLIHLDGTEGLDSADPWLGWNDLPVRSGGFFGDITRTAYPELIHNFNLPNDPVVGESLAAYRSLMAIPLFDDGEPLNWAVFLKKEPDGFSVYDLEQAILRANLVGTTVKNALIAKELREAHAVIRDEVDRIATIQRALLPQPIPKIPGLSIATSYETFDQAGGDHYDFRPLQCDATGERADPNGPWSILIADASGHGPAAAVVMAMMHAIMHAYPRQPGGPAEVLEHANRHLAAKRIENSFVTAFLAIYDPPARRLTYARAGHNPPLLKNPGVEGSVQRLDAVGGIPLGVADHVKYDEMTVQLKLGQTVVLYTDGISEARGPNGTMFGVEGIERALAECTGDPQCVVQSISNPLHRHVARVRPSDDQTILAIRVEAPGEDPCGCSDGD